MLVFRLFTPACAETTLPRRSLKLKCLGFKGTSDGLAGNLPVLISVLLLHTSSSIRSLTNGIRFIAFQLFLYLLYSRRRSTLSNLVQPWLCYRLFRWSSRYALKKRAIVREFYLSMNDFWMLVSIAFCN